jgi:histidinol phosphatase-like enzyme
VSKRGAWGVFLDRDGVLNDVVMDAASGVPESPYRPEDVTLLAGSAEAVRLLIDAARIIALATAQTGRAA